MADFLKDAFFLISFYSAKTFLADAYVFVLKLDSFLTTTFLFESYFLGFLSFEEPCLMTYCYYYRLVPGGRLLLFYFEILRDLESDCLGTCETLFRSAEVYAFNASI